jgi:hypothetical protein
VVQKLQIGGTIPPGIPAMFGITKISQSGAIATNHALATGKSHNPDAPLRRQRRHSSEPPLAS